jgi:SPP1 family predicted phage head-tail adaptor
VIVRAGKLRFRVDIEQPTPTTDAAGGEVPAFEPYATVWADIMPLKGRERLASDQVVAEVDTRIVVRWSEQIDAVTPKWRIVHDGAVYDIKFVGHIGLRQREVEFMCQSGVSEG